jgi:hypothetical protein
MSRMHRVLSALLLSVGLMFALSAAGYAYFYDNSDPYNTGCYRNASTVASARFNASITPGTLYLRYSWSCGTAWAQFVCDSNANGFIGCTDYCIDVFRGNDGYSLPNFPCVAPWEHTPPGRYVYSQQIYDGGSLYSRACMRFWDNPDSWNVCTSWF